MDLEDVNIENGVDPNNLDAFDVDLLMLDHRRLEPHSSCA